MREHLSDASSAVETAAEHTDDADTRERLEGIADQLATLAEREQAPDHGRLARILNALGDVEDEVGPDASAAIADAREHVTEFRKTIEGV